MTPKKVRIKDSNFAHDTSMSVGKSPTYFSWVRDNEPADQWTFITDSHLTSHTGGIAMLVEPPSISPQIYKYISNNNHKYRYVLTYIKDLYSRGENFLFYPFITTRIAQRNFKIYPKTKLCSIILSQKRMTPNQVFRHQCKDLCRGYGVDVFEAPSLDSGSYIDKLKATKDYFFSVCVENGVYETYITEKIGDNFVNCTLPIYNGAPDIGDFFDERGILKFSNLEELENILQKISFRLYYNLEGYVVENYKRVMDYIIPEDYIFRNYPFLFCK